MLKIEFKNTIRAFLGFISIVLPGGKPKNYRLYCNLAEGKGSGGPARFLHNLLESSEVKSNVVVKNWSLKNCASALVFSTSWGDSFSNICRKQSIRSVLRVDGFYVPDESINDEIIHGVEYRAWLNDRIEKDLRLFDHIIYQSKFSKRICDEYLYKRDTEFTIINNGIDTKHFKPDKLKRDTDVLKLVMLGKHYPKHLRVALDIFKIANKRQKIELLIVGPMRNGEDRVEDFILEYDVNTLKCDQISCKGQVSFNELPTVLNESDIFLHVKIGDSCPNAVLEAMGCGLPVICPAWGGTKELVGDAGICVEGPPWDIDEGFVEGMVNAIFDIQSNMLSYKEKARERAVNMFDINHVSKQYLSVLGYEE